MREQAEHRVHSGGGTSENLFWVELVRVVAVFGVVLTHVAADVVTEWGVLPKSWWWVAHLYDSLVRGGVPVFIMLSGALLLPKTESYRDFFHKRFDRILIPFVAWTVLYLFWKKLFYQPDLGFQEALRMAASGHVYFHLWFLYLIVGLYLITPVFRILVAHGTERDILYFLALCFFFSSFLPFAEKLYGMFAKTNFHIWIPVEPAQGYIGYFVLGHFLKRYVTEKAVPTAWAIWSVCLFICVFGTYFLCLKTHFFQTLFYDNMAPNMVFFTASFFIIMKYTGPVLENHTGPGLRNIILTLSHASFGIYLIHPIFIDILAKGRWGFVLKANLPDPVFMIPLTAAGIYILSFLAILAIRKIPYLKKIA